MASLRADRPRVLHVVPALFGPQGVVGGAERYAYELARHMARVVPTTLVAYGEADREEFHGALRVRVFGRPWHVRRQTSNPFSVRILREILRADIVHCHQQHILTSSVAAAAARLSGRRVYCSDLGGGGWDISAYISTDGWYHAHLHISQYSRDVFGHRDRDNAIVIYGGVDCETFAPDPSRERTLDCVFVGRLLPHKGVDVLIEGLPPGCRLMVIGPALDQRYLHDLQRLAQGKSVMFIHSADDHMVVDAYRRARCVALPSVYRDRYGGETRVPELLGQTLLEGMACGAAGLCTDVASLPEVVRHGETGLVVPPGDPRAIGRALQWFMDHPEETTAMGRAGREHVLSTFRWDLVVGRCLQAYGVA